MPFCRSAVLALVPVLFFVATPAAADIPVTGRVVDPGGRPLPDAQVVLLPAVDPVSAARLAADGKLPASLATSRTDSGGRFSLAAPAAGFYTVRVEAPGYVPVEHALSPLLEPEELADTAPPHDSGLTVRVATREGKPVPGALVRLVVDRSRFGDGPGAWRPADRTGRTGADGAVRLPRAEDETSIVAAHAPGFLEQEAARVRGTATTLRLEAGAAAAVEVVTAEGAPVAGALVTTGQASQPIGTTDAAGRATIAVPRKGGLRVRVVAADGRDAKGEVSAPVKQPAEARRFILPAVVPVDGKLIDAETRAPVETGLAWTDDVPWGASTPNAAGAFSLLLPAGRSVRVSAAAPGYLPAEPIAVRAGSETPRVHAIALQPAAAIEGTVVDSSGAPVAGAEVSLAERQPAGVIRIRIGGPQEGNATRTSSSGRFRLTAVKPGPAYDLETRAEGFASATKEIVGLEARRTLSGVRVELDRGRAVVGRVVDPDGRPLRDAGAVLRPAPKGRREFAGMALGGDGPAEALKGLSQPDGAFRITGVAAGSYDLEVRCKGFAKGSVRGVEVPASGEPLDLGDVKLEPGVTLYGLVRDPAGKAVEGADVRLSEGGPRMMLGAARGAAGASPDAITGPDGGFTIDGQRAGSKISLAISRVGYVPANPSGIDVPRTEPLAVVLQPASKVSGVVVDPDHKPIAGADVTMTRSQTGGVGGQTLRFVMRDAATADDRGRFTFENVEPGTISLGASSAEWQEAKLDGVAVPQGKDVDGIEIELQPGAVVEGQVVAPDGRPAVGAEVGPVREGGDPIRFGGAGSDGEGRFRIEGLAPGHVSIEATHPSYVRTVKDLDVRPGLNTLRLQFEGGQSVSGRIADAGGTPVAGAWVRLETPERGWGGPEALSGADGSFELEGVADGTYTLRAGKRGYAPAALDAPLRVEGQPVTGVVVRLPRGAVITGTITGVEPDKLGEIQIRGFSIEAAASSESQADRKGSYRLEDVTSGRWVVTAAVPSTGQQARGEVTVERDAPEAHLDLDFGRGLTLSGRVTRGDAPVAGASMFAQGIDVNRGVGGRTDADGRFSIQGLDPGTYRLDLQQWDTGLSYSETFEVKASREVRIAIPTARVAGRIVDATDEQPISGATVTIAAASEGRGRSTLVGRGATSDLDGRFEIGDVGDGSWRLTISRSGYGAATRDVSVQSGRSVEDVRVALEPTDGLTLQVTLPSGRAPDEVTAAVLDGGGRPVVQGVYATGEAGRVRLPSVPAGTWEVLVRAGDSGTVSTRATAPGGPVPVALPPASTLTIVVPALADATTAAEATLTGADGRPFRSLQWYAAPDATWRLGGGRARIESLPPGAWKIAIRASDGRTWAAQAVTQPGASAEVIVE